MGFGIEICDTLKLKRGINFPPGSVKLGNEYAFEIEDIRLYNLYPSRVYLVEEIDGKWHYIGHAQILEQTIDARNQKTKGIFEVVKIYPEDYVQQVNQFEAPQGKGFKTTDL